MSPPDFQRARQPQQKRQRQEDILRAAREFLDEEGLNALTLNGLARKVGLAKSNLYRYFETREAILLHILWEDWSSWAEAWERELPRLRAKNRRLRVARYIAESAVERPHMCELISVLASVLEQNMSVDQIRSFKRSVMVLVQRMAVALHKALPDISPIQHVEVVRYMYALIGSIWPTTHPAAAVETVLSEPEFKGVYIGFVPEFSRGIYLILRGLEAEIGIEAL